MQEFNRTGWTESLPIELIKRTLGGVYKLSQVYNILKKRGLTYQKGKGVYPVVVDSEEKNRRVKKIHKELREADGVILFEDEASLSNTATFTYHWSEKGK